MVKVLAMTVEPRGNIKDVNQEELGKIGERVDGILALCLASIDSLRDFAFKFQYDQATEKAAYENAEGQADPMEHLRHVLQRMVDLALGTANVVYVQSRDWHRRSRCKGASESDPSFGSMSTFQPQHMLRKSSVQDFTEGSSAWLERVAHISLFSLEVLSSALLAHPTLRNGLQCYLYESKILLYLREIFSMDRDHELSCFPEGFKTESMRLVANLTHENTEVSNALVEEGDLLFNILCATRIDEENPGMVEWAEFALRNICESSGAARDKIKKLTPQGVSEESKQLLSGKCNYSFGNSGKLQIHATRTL